jgi:predicted CXXCH cytochrome family protein
MIRGDMAMVCASCHLLFRPALQAAHAHPPFEDGDCALCHVTHSGPEASGLVQPQGELCAGCHDDVMEGTQGRPHDPVAEGNCTACHDAHAAPEPGLLASADLGNTCFTCHLDMKPDPGEEGLHEPFAAGDCSSCHDPHGSSGQGFLVEAVPGLCATCHDAQDDGFVVAHGEFDLSQADCMSCHNPHRSTAPGLLGEFVHEPFADGDCSVCHEEEDGQILTVEDVDEICLACHDSESLGLGGRHVHSAAVTGPCTACHEAHASDTEHLLVDSTPRLCAECHDEATPAGLGVAAHAPIREGDCLACHAAHGSDEGSLLKESSQTLCGDCHLNATPERIQASTHAPFTEGDCSICHQSHATGRVEGLLRGTEAELCGSCHDLEDPDIQGAHDRIELANARCTSCHDPHGATPGLKDGIIYAYEHAPFADDECDACHISGTNRLVSSGRDLCYVCHSDQEEVFEESFSHPLVEDEGDCLACHSPHTSPHASLLKRTREAEVCYSCHDRAVYQKEHTHLAGERGCSDCHVSHGSELSASLKGSVPDLCFTCHEDQRDHGHPMGEGVLDPRTEETLSCMGCHDPHSSAHQFILTHEHRRELCIQCHEVQH